MQDPSHAFLDTLSSEVEKCLLADQAYLRKKILQIRKRLKSGQSWDRLRDELEQRVATSSRIRALRATQMPDIVFPAELPVSAKAEEIAREIENHPVVIIAGETGSGKTTQIPKICLQLGRGIAGRIGHTQPRRIAARSVAQRIADELQTELGSSVGYQVRFTDRIRPESRLKLMTDGILLAEIQGDRDLLQYDTIIIDEAHERSLNIDFLLGYLRQLLPRRPDLKIIITSATIATGKFSAHFEHAPVIEVSGRTYPVEVRYRPLVSEDPDEEDLEMQDAILASVDELSRIDRGDMLVFLSGEREIRDTAEALRKHHPQATEILPLFSRLSISEQNRVFQAHGRQRIILATNVAETSLTVPGIRYVIDSGYARMSRYSYRSKVQRLPIEKISRASADQRKGRCGRVSAGICIRLFSEQDYLDRPEFTEPEIQRTNLASVILNMKMLGLGEIEEFPFMDPPDRRFINDGYRLLFELGAVDGNRKLTGVGREMAKFPVDPRLARMLIQARRESCLSELLVIVCALTIQDPRERPLDKQQKADAAHKDFNDERSDFMLWLNLWSFYLEQRKHLSRNKLRQLCHDRFLSSRRLQEWYDLHQQLRQQVAALGMRFNTEPAEYDSIHRAILSGLLSHVGIHSEDQVYSGSHGKKFLIFPGSGLHKKRPKWIMAAELMETSRVYARIVATIQPQWIEPLAAHLVKRSYTEPHWEKRSGQVAARETQTLYGLVIVSGRKVNYGPIDPQTSREIFIRAALVEGDFNSRAKFFVHNQDLLHDIRTLEDKSRRRDIQVDEETLHAFYNERIPQDIYNQPAFEKWLKAEAQRDPRCLFLRREDLVRANATPVSTLAYPDHLDIRGVSIPLEYHFDPGDDADGVTARIPLPVLNQVSEQDFDWLVPGMLEEKVTQLIRTLPKSLRRNFVPAPDFARACIDAFSGENGDLKAGIRRQLKRMTGIDVPDSAWQPEAIPAHLRMRFGVVDSHGKILATGRDLEALQAQWGSRAQDSFVRQVSGDRTATVQEREDVKCWDFGELAEAIEISQGGITLRAYPALVLEGDRIALRLRDSAERANAETRDGLVALFRRVHKKQIDYLKRNLPQLQRMCMYYATLGSCESLREDLVNRIVALALDLDHVDIRDAAVFERQGERANGSLIPTANDFCTVVLKILESYHALAKQLAAQIKPAWLPSIQDMREQLDLLLPKHFACSIPYGQLQNLPRYLKALQRRREKLALNPERDRQLMREVEPFWQDYLAQSRQGQERISGTNLQAYYWMIEEFRVSLFAQELKTAFPISAKRLREQQKLLRQ